VFKAASLSIVVAAIVLSLPQPAAAEFPAELGPVEGKVVWVDFWASWCAPCRRSFPWMNRMQAAYSDQGLQIIGVNVDKERRLARDFLSKTPADFGLRYDPEGALAQRFGVQAMPSSFLLDAAGHVIATHYGFRLGETEEYEAQIRDALAAAASGAGTAPAAGAGSAATSGARH
jgi:thiol-disulfide isomerase/thioredoxin